ncbi:hypothetical protein B0H19DRAFT_1116227 [Mycena capillaripes]|nr:hypothetical protein B0H19DRAFT_1116227 [Mycena capillaripes]
MATPAQTVTDASSPFDDPSGDIIIRSSENVDFRMHKVLLSLASSFFKEMFEIPQGQTVEGEGKQRFKPDEVRDGIPVIFMYDDQNRVCGKDVVEFILGSCHPARFHSIAPLPAEMVQPVIDVATRYRMDWAVKAVLHDPHLLKTNPFLVFAHASHRGFSAEVALAANGTLRFRIQDFPLEPALKLISAYQYHILLEFHKRCGKAAAGIARGEIRFTPNETLRETIDWIPSETLRSFPRPHGPCSSIHDPGSQANQVKHWNFKLRLDGVWHSTQSWWTEYMESTAVALESRPHSSTVKNPVLADPPLTKGSSCETCRVQAISLMRDFIPLFEQKIDDVVRKIIAETVFT